MSPLAPELATLTGNRLHDKYIEYAIKRYAKLAGVPVVSSHGLRGGFASALVEAGALTHLVAAVMGHGSFERITAKHYATDGALQAAQQKARRKHLKLL